MPLNLNLDFALDHADEDHFGVPHLAAEITQVAAMPSYAAMEKIIAALS